jgi:hypothetical protein
MQPAREREMRAVVRWIAGAGWPGNETQSNVT